MSETKKLIIAFNGQEGSGKSTIAKLVAEKLGLPRYYMGQMFRDMAAEKGLDLPEFRKLCDQDPDFDKKVDDYIIALGKEKDNFVIESRTAWHFIPESLKIFLKVDPRVAAQRIFKNLAQENNRANEDKKISSEESIVQSILLRRKEDSRRYQEYYGIDQDNDNNYDLIIDTTNLNIQQVFDKIMDFIKNNESKK